MADTLARTRLLVGTTANWGAADLVLGDGELVLERTSANQIRMKAGNGTLKFSQLPYVSAVGAVGAAAYRGTADGTVAVPAGVFAPGDYYINTGTGAAHASWGLTAGTNVAPSQELVFNGTNWALVGSGMQTMPRLADGTAALPALAFVNDAGLGLSRSATSDLVLSSGGAEKVRLMAAADPKLLLGLTAPTAAPAGQALVEVGGASSAAIGLTAGGTRRGTVSADATGMALTTPGASITSTVGGVTTITQQAGIVGVGTAPIANTPLTVGNKSGNGLLVTGGTTGFNGPDVAIQKSGPDNVAGAAAGACLQLVNSTSGTSVLLQQYANIFQLFNYTGNTWTERLRVDGGGNLGVGNPTPQNRIHAKTASATCTVMTETSITSDAAFRSKTTVGDYGSGTGIAVGANYWIVYDYGSGTQCVSANNSGFYPGADTTRMLGNPTARWSTVYAATGTINTSDAREKTPVEPLTAAELATAKALAREVGTFQYLAMLEDKGDDARVHTGLTVQRAIEIMEAQGLDAMRYGLVCFDQWDDELDADGEVIHPAGDRYGFRSDELLLLMARGLDERLSAIEAAISAKGN
jgi:hypothetical protein